MRKALIAVALPLASTMALAQLPDSVQRSSSPSGFKVQGSTTVNAVGSNLNTVAVGKDNTAKNAAGTVKGNVQIQGNTQINAVAKNANAVAVGKGNTAANEVGSIGAK